MASKEEQNILLQNANQAAQAPGTPLPPVEKEEPSSIRDRVQKDRRVGLLGILDPLIPDEVGDFLTNTLSEVNELGASLSGERSKQPLIDALASLGDEAKLKGPKSDLFVEFLKSEQLEKALSVLKEERSFTDKRQQQKDLDQLIAGVPGLDRETAKLGRSLNKIAGPKAGIGFIKSITTGALSKEKAKDLALFNRGLRARERDVFNTIIQGVDSGELNPDADDEAVNAFLLQKGKKFSDKQAERLVKRAREQGFLGPSEGFLAMLFRKAKEIISPAKQAEGQPEDRVKVQKDGKIQTVPRSQLEAAKRQGFVEVN